MCDVEIAVNHERSWFDMEESFIGLTHLYDVHLKDMLAKIAPPGATVEERILAHLMMTSVRMTIIEIMVRVHERVKHIEYLPEGEERTAAIKTLSEHDLKMLTATGMLMESHPEGLLPIDIPGLT